MSKNVVSSELIHRAAEPTDTDDEGCSPAAATLAPHQRPRLRSRRRNTTRHQGRVDLMTSRQAAGSPTTAADVLGHRVHRLGSITPPSPRTARRLASTSWRVRRYPSNSAYRCLRARQTSVEMTLTTWRRPATLSHSTYVKERKGRVFI